MNRSTELLHTAKERLHQLKIKTETRRALYEQVEQEKIRLEELRRKRDVYIEASGAVLQYLERGRARSKTIFEEIGTAALQSLYGENAKVQIEYSEKRNTSVAELKTTLPEDDIPEEIGISLGHSGGGVNDVVCFAFILALLEMSIPPLEGPLLMDESFKFLDATRKSALGELLRSTLNPDGTGAEGEGRQLIFVTHEQEYLDYADKVLEFSKVKGKVEVKGMEDTAPKGES